MTRGLLFARTRASPRTLLVAALATTASAAVQGQTFLGPVVPWKSIVLTTPLLPAVFSVATLPVFAAPMPELEATARVEMARLRTRWALCWLAGGSVGWFLIVLVGNDVNKAHDSSFTFSAASAGRNTAFFMALTLGSAVLLGSDLAWTGLGVTW